jgi:PAS domain S-box-containing protein
MCVSDKEPLPVATDAELRESEERFRSLFMNAPIAIYVHDKDSFEMLDANWRACQSYGYRTVEELKAADIWLDPPYSFEDAKRWMQKAVNEGHQHYEWCSRSSSGALFWEQLQLVKIPIGGKECLLVMATDITQRKQAEAEMEHLNDQMRRAMQIEAHQVGKIETATGILHDIGNAISGMGAVLIEYREGDIWPEIDRLKRLLALLGAEHKGLDAVLGEGRGAMLCAYIEKLLVLLDERARRQQAATDRAESIISHISNILTLQRRYALSGAVSSRQPVYLGELMDDALNMMAASIEKRRIHVDRRYTRPDGHVSGDQTALVQVFINLLKNVCESFDQEAMPQAPALRIEIATTAAGCEMVIADNAHGFAPEALDHLFERAYTTKPQGSGIGLPFVRGVMQAHGGSIRLESPGIGRGATAFLSFPLAPTTGETVP